MAQRSAVPNKVRRWVSGGCLVVLSLAAAACSGSKGTGPAPTGVVAGTVSSSRGGGLAGVSVVVTPTGAGALPAVTTTASGSYSVSGVPVGSGAVAVSGVPSTCSAPASATYNGLATGGTATVNIVVTCQPPPGTVAGKVTSSLGGAISGATVTVTPTGGAALPSVTTDTAGSYSVSGVPPAAGTGSVAVTAVPGNCATPPVASYSGLTAGATVTANVTVSCVSSPSLVLAVGQSAIFADSSHFLTQLGLDPNAKYLIAVVNTDSTSTIHEDFTLQGTPAVSGSALARSQGRVPTRAPVRQVLPFTHPLSVSGRPLPTDLASWQRLLDRMHRTHMAALDFDRAVFRQLGRPRVGGVGQGVNARASSLVGSKVGDVNKIYVNKLTGSCAAVDSIGARTVYVGQHIQVLADTQAWAARPDSSFWTAFGSEWDQITYPHLVTYFGDPLAFDQSLSKVGKVTFVFTPLVNHAGDAGFVISCDFFPPVQAQFSNFTEIVYAWTPNPAGGVPVNFWERDFRSVAAHESKHVASLGQHFFDGAAAFEQSWLEEAMAQQSSEIWMRHFNSATWRSDAGFNQTVGCEFDTSDSCFNANNPVFFSDRVTFEFYHYLESETAAPANGGFANSTNGKYGGGWAFIRWATDVFGGAVEGAFTKALVDDPTFTGMANVSQHAGMAAPRILVYWSLASAFDQSTLADSATFHPTDSIATVPSFDFRNMFSVSATSSAGSFPQPFAVSTQPLSPGPFTQTVTGVPGTGVVYFLLSTSTSTGPQSLQLLSGTGHAISPSSGFRVGIIRVQ